MNGRLLDLDQPLEWPAVLRAYLDEHHDLFLAWDTKRQAQVSAQRRREAPERRLYNWPPLSAEAFGKETALALAFDGALSSLWDALQTYEILGWHCTRLTKTEAVEILRSGMQLPDAEMLARRIDAVVKDNLIAPDVALRLKSENEAHDKYRAGNVWFCFSPPGNVDEHGIGRFFRHWGGEALYVCHEDDPLTSPVLGRIGTPCLIEVEVPIASLEKSGEGLSWNIALRFLISCGYCSKESTDYEASIVHPLPARNVKRVIPFPDPDFYSLTSCSEWQEFALELTEHSG